MRSEMEVVLRCENYMFKSLTVVDFTILYVVTRRLLLSSRVSLLVINLRLKRRLERSVLIKTTSISLRTTADSRMKQNR